MGKYQRIILRMCIGLLLFCLPVSAFSADKVTLQLIWKNQFQFAGYYVAKELGFYDDAGLDVTIKEYEFGMDVTAEVVSQKADFGVGRSSLILERMEGKPVFLLSAIFQHSPFMLLAKKRADLKEVADLKGKRIMVTDDVVGMASLTAMLTGYGIKPDDYISQKHTFSIDDLISGNTDAIAAYISNEPYHMQKRGVDYTIFAPKDHGFDFYSDILFTSQKLYQDNPQLVERFRQASLRGWDYAFAHIDEAVDIILKKYNTQNRDQDALRFEADTLKKLAYERDTALGVIAKGRVEKIAQVYQLLGFTNKPLKTAGLIYTPKDNVRIQLTAVERAWLDAHPVIRVVNDKNYPPYDFYRNGRAQGFSVDYLELLAKIAGFRIQWESRDDWDGAVEDLKNKKVDALHSVSTTEARKAYTLFTKSYFRNLTALFSRKDNQTFGSVEDLSSATVAIPKGYADKEFIQRSYPKSTIIETDGPREALKLVALGKADVTPLDSGVGNFLIPELGLGNIKIATYAFFGTNKDEDDFFIGVRNDWPELVGILNKAMDSIDVTETRKLKRLWLLGDEQEKETRITLSAKEKAFLTAHSVIRVHNEKDWPPFNYFEYGRPRGLSIDYMDLVAARLGIDIEYVTGPSWNEFLGIVQRKELDVMLNIVKTEDRMKYLLYTEPYIKNPNVIVSSQESPYETIQALFGKTVAFPKGFFQEEILTKSFPQINRLPVEDTLASLKAVMFRRADAALVEAAVARTMIAKSLLTGLRISGELDLGDPDLANLRLGVRDDWPLLQSALMKAMAVVTPEEMNRIRQKWLTVDKKDIPTSMALDRRKVISLSATEKAWLAEHKKIRFTGDPDWLPQEAFTSEGQYVGIVADILDLVEARLGLLFERVPVKTWTEAVRLAEAAEVDVLSETTSSERETMTFTEPYLAFPVVIIAKQGTQPITDPGALKGKRVAVVKGYGYVIPFRRQYPDLDYVVVETVRDGLMRLSAGEVDAFISAAPTAYHLMSELGLTNLKVIGSTGLSIDLGFGVRKDAPVLVSILNKALAGITEDEKLKIRQKWVPVIDTSAPQTAAPISYGRLLVFGIAVFLILSLLAWILIKTIKREQIAVSFGSSWFRGLVLAGLSVFVLIVAFIGWYMLEHNKTEHLLNVDENLRGVISVNEDRLDLWLKERISYLARLGRDPELVAITKRLLQVKANKRDLLASGALKEARFFFKNTEDIFGNIGFFIIDPDHVSIGSVRDANLGTRNLISKQNPDLLQRAFQGKVDFVPPMTSDVDLGNTAKSDNAKKLPTMFFIGPVQDTDGRVLAVMTLRVDPWKDFARALKSFGGASGESYAFDRNGVMLSSSRFEDQLRRIGLLAEDQTSALNVEIRDPGGNMVAGYRPAIERSQQPLTRMVSRALVLRQQMESAGIRKGRSSIESNIEGYRDYRGVPVFGAWLWNADLDIGLAVEVDVDEALSHYYRTRVTIFSILGFTLVLSAGAILFVLIVGERTSRALMRARDNLEKKVTERTAELRKLSQATENSPASVVVTDKNGTIEYVNPRFSEVTGYTAEEAIGQNPSVLKSGDLPESYYQELWDTILAGKVWRGEFKNKRKNDEEFWESASISPIKNEAGEITHFVAVKEDITEQKKIRESLRESEIQLRTIFRNSPIGITYVGKDGTVLDCNDRHAEIMGSTREKIIGMNLREEIKNEGLRAAVFGALAGEQTDFEAEYTSISGGKTILVRSLFNPTEPGISPTEVINTTEDITERKQMEQDLLEAKDRLQAIIDGVHSLVFIKNTQGQHLLVNSYFEEAFGIKKEDVIGKTDLDIFPFEVAEQIMEVDRKVMTTGEAIHLEVPIPHQNGNIHIHLTEKFPLLNKKGEVYAMCGLATDISHQKDIEQELQQAKMVAEDATRAKSDFLANMSHEIRTPMNAVIGMAHLALKTELTPKQQDYLNKIQSSANSLLGIINDILDFSKIEAGKLDMEALEFNLDDVLDNLANLVTVKAQEKEELEVLFATAREVPRFLVGDPLRLGQVLINLANNAVKFTDSGEIVVSTELLEQAESGLTIQFSVRDTGIGLTEEQIGKLFQSFSQADTSTTRKFGGTGLGLTISKRLVEIMGGEIWVESEPGQGTNFSFTADFGLGKEKVKKRLIPSSDLRGMKVLVVDDSATSRNILQDILESFSFEVTLAASAEEGLEEIQKADPNQPYELVLMDWKMPGLDGLAASEHIKKHQTLSKIPAIILVTAYGREEIMQQADEIGLDGFLIKPIGPSVLFDTIMQAFGERGPKISRITERYEKTEGMQNIQGAKVLLVEDNEINQQVALEILQGAGLNVTVANDGQQGVDAAMQTQYDAILMDIQMPVMDGYEATKRIRKWEGERMNAEVGMRNAETMLRGQKSDNRGQRTDNRSQMTELGSQASNLQAPTSNIPIIAMTAHAMAGDDKKSIEAGMNDHVTKPIDPDQLFATLQKWIKPAAERAAVQKPSVLDAPPEPDQVVPHEEALPESLPGFNLAAGLERLMGNKRLYRKLLVDFGTKYTETAREIREALDAKDFDQAHSLVHNLKGLAGNLEATDLQAAAVEMEKLVKGQTAKASSNKDIKQRFKELENALDQALNAVRTLVSLDENKTTASSGETIASVPPELIKKVTEKIKAAVEMGDVMKIKSIAEELKSESDAVAPFCDELVRLAEDFDFDGIQRFMLEFGS